MKHLLPLLLIVSSTVGCSARWDKNPQSEPGAAGAVRAQVGAAPSYAEVRSRVLANRCIVCHQASSSQNGGVLLEDYASTKAALGAIRSAVFVDKTMPKGGSLSAEEAAVLQAWIQAGGPETSGAPADHQGTSPNPQQPVPDQYRWPRVQALVFQKSCASCHEFDAPMAREQIDPIIQRALIKRDMPPQPASLTEEQLSILTQWIRYGMSD